MFASLCRLEPGNNKGIGQSSIGQSPCLPSRLALSWLWSAPFVFLFWLSLSLVLSLCHSLSRPAASPQVVPGPPENLQHGADIDVTEDHVFYDAIAREEGQLADKRRPRADDDTEPDADAEPEGSGPRGNGPPMQVGSFERERPLCDGAGLCSLGRWRPADRPHPSHPKLIALRAMIEAAVMELPATLGMTASQLFDLLAEGRIESDPFPPHLRAALYGRALDIFADAQVSGHQRPTDRPLALHLRLLEAILHAGGDPDRRGLDQYAQGVRLGIGVRMPRTPAVFAPKRHWRLKEQCTADEWEGFPVASVWRDNYRSVDAHQDLVEAQLADHHARGLAIRLSPEEAAARFPDLTVASMGAVAKIPDPKHFNDIRIVVDGSNGVNLNTRVKQRDQDRCPTAADVKRVQRAQSAEPRRPVGLALDVHEAHRIPPTREEDWRHQGVRSSSAGNVYIYKYNMFGSASSAYWWARLGGALTRSVHLVASPGQRLWLLLMADDFKAESTSDRGKEDIIWLIIYFTCLGVPLTWRKTQGGTLITWIGYSVNLLELSLGISASRADWSANWLERCARDGACCMEEFASALGRLTFVAGALEYDRPFLAPLHTFAAASPRRGIRVLPVFVRVIARFLADRLRKRRHYPSAQRRSPVEPFRVDARADGELIGVGGWRPARFEDGSIDKASSRWFSIQLSRSSAPWAYDKGEAFRTIASLEALAALLATILLTEPCESAADGVLVASGFTDNRGNRYVLTRLQTQRYPLNILVMELAAQLERRGMRLALDWSPREVNTEADALAAGHCQGFTEKHRCTLDLSSNPWLLLDKFVVLGREFEAHCRALHTKGKERETTRKKKLAHGTFREREPW